MFWLRIGKKTVLIGLNIVNLSAFAMIKNDIQGNRAGKIHSSAAGK